MTRIAWYLGNWIAALVFAFRVGYRDGSVLRPGTKPAVIKQSPCGPGFVLCAVCGWCTKQSLTACDHCGASISAGEKP